MPRTSADLIKDAQLKKTITSDLSYEAAYRRLLTPMRECMQSSFIGAAVIENDIFPEKEHAVINLHYLGTISNGAFMEGVEINGEGKGSIINIYVAKDPLFGDPIEKYKRWLSGDGSC